jgi:hypothetical protein
LDDLVAPEIVIRLHSGPPDSEPFEVRGELRRIAVLLNKDHVTISKLLQPGHHECLSAFVIMAVALEASRFPRKFVHSFPGERLVDIPHVVETMTHLILNRVAPEPYDPMILRFAPMPN